MKKLIEIFRLIFELIFSSMAQHNHQHEQFFDNLSRLRDVCNKDGTCYYCRRCKVCNKTESENCGYGVGKDGTCYLCRGCKVYNDTNAENGVMYDINIYLKSDNKNDYFNWMNRRCDVCDRAGHVAGKDGKCYYCRRCNVCKKTESENNGYGAGKDGICYLCAGDARFPL